MTGELPVGGLNIFKTEGAPIYVNSVHQSLGITEDRVNKLHEILLNNQNVRIAAGLKHAAGLDDETALLTLKLFSWPMLQFSEDREKLKVIKKLMKEVGV